MAKKFSIINEAGKVLDDENKYFTHSFLEKHFGKILIVIILLLCHIQLRYEYEDRILHIAQLKRERNDVRYTSIEKWGILTLRNRPEVIKAKVAASGLQLKECDEPPVRIDN